MLQIYFMHNFMHIQRLMEKINYKNIIEQLQASDPTFSRLEVLPVFYSFFICVIISFIVRFFYIRYSNSAVGKLNLGNILPILSSIVFIVILVVKSSLALSLGLVGALSIVRFRTPIKEPEELIYLFLSIAIGLGCAANYVLITSTITLIILLFIYFFLSDKKNINNSKEYSLMINWTNNDINLGKILKIFDSKSSSISLLRYTVNHESNNAIFLLESDKLKNIDDISSEIRILDDKRSIYKQYAQWFRQIDI